MEEELQQMIQELGNAINASLSDSDRFAAAMADLEQAGYDVYVVLEASFGFRRKGEQSEVESRDSQIHVTPQSKPNGQRRVEMSDEDHEFLRALKISAD